MIRAIKCIFQPISICVSGWKVHFLCVIEKGDWLI